MHLTGDIVFLCIDVYVLGTVQGVLLSLLLFDDKPSRLK